MGYALICTAAILFSLQFLFQKEYKNKYGSGLKAGLNFQMYASAIGAAVIFVVNLIVTKKMIGFSFFTAVTALMYAIFTVAYAILSLKAMETANIAIFSMLAMLGGMFVPFVYGIIVNREAIDYKKIIGLVLMVAALIFFAKPGTDKPAELQSSENSDGEKGVWHKKSVGGANRKTGLYYFAVFLLNGSFGVISTFHQSPKFTLIAESGYSLMVYAQLFASLLSFALILVLKCGVEKLSLKIFGLTSLYAGFNGIGNLFTVLALLTLPASVQYPIITGGTIIVSSAIFMISRKKFILKYAAAATVSLAATVLFVI